MSYHTFGMKPEDYNASLNAFKKKKMRVNYKTADYLQKKFPHATDEECLIASQLIHSPAANSFTTYDVIQFFNKSKTTTK